MPAYNIKAAAGIKATPGIKAVPGIKFALLLLPGHVDAVAAQQRAGGHCVQCLSKADAEGRRPGAASSRPSQQATPHPS